MRLCGLVFGLQLLAAAPGYAFPIDAADAASAANADAPSAAAASAPVDPARLAAALAIADAAVNDPSPMEDRRSRLQLSLGLKPAHAGLSLRQPALGVEPVLTPVLANAAGQGGGESVGGQAGGAQAQENPARLSGPIREFLLAVRADPVYTVIREHKSLLLAAGLSLVLAVIALLLAMRRPPSESKRPLRRRRRRSSAAPVSAPSASATAGDRQSRRRSSRSHRSVS